MAEGVDPALERLLVVMSRIVVTRRAALMSFSALAASGLSGCNTTQAPVVATQGAPAAVSGYRIGAINVDTAPLLAESGNPTASWVQQALPGYLAQAFAWHMAPGDPSGGALSVTINSIYLGGGGPANPDVMTGVATLSGGAAPARMTRLRATSTYIPSPVDQTLVGAWRGSVWIQHFGETAPRLMRIASHLPRSRVGSARNLTSGSRVRWLMGSERNT